MVVLSPSFASLVAVSLAAIASCSPLKSANEPQEIQLSKRFSLWQPNSEVVDFSAVRTHLDNVKAKYSHGLQQYEHNVGKTNPLQALDFTPFLHKRATGSVSLQDVNSEELWTGAVTYGTQTIDVDFDTGSSDVIINHNSYTPGSTAKNTGKTFQTSYGDGTTASGPVYTDAFSIGGISASNVGLGWANQQFLTGENPNNGIAGMAYPNLAQTGVSPFFDALQSQGKLSSFVFTFTLKPSGASLYLGGIPSSVTNPTYSSVTNQAYWTIAGSVNGVSTASIIDTGTSVIVAPTASAKRFFTAIGGITQFTQDGVTYGAYNCNRPPKVTLKFGSFTKTLSTRTAYLGQQTNNGMCVLSIIGEDIGIQATIFGDSFLQNVNAVFDRQNNRVGFTSQ